MATWTVEMKDGWELKWRASWIYVSDMEGGVYLSCAVAPPHLKPFYQIFWIVCLFFFFQIKDKDCHYFYFLKIKCV